MNSFKIVLFLISSLLYSFTTISVFAEPVFEKEFKTGSYPETKIIRYRILGHKDAQKGFAFSFTGKVSKGQIVIQIEDAQRNIIEERQIPGFSLLHWYVVLPEDKKLENTHIVLNLEEAIADIYCVVAPLIETQKVYANIIFILLVTLFLLFLSGYIIWRYSIPIAWIFWGIIITICAKTLFYIWDYFDFLPIILLISSSNSGEDITDYTFSAYISLRETSILFLLLGILSNFILSKKRWERIAVAISLGMTAVFLISIAIDGLLEAISFSPDINVSSSFIAFSSIQTSRTPLLSLMIPIKNILLCGLWFSSFYMVLSGTINYEKRLVMQGILLFIIVQAVLVYLEKSQFLIKYSSWWSITLLLIISFFPVFILKFQRFLVSDGKIF